MNVPRAFLLVAFLILTGSVAEPAWSISNANASTALQLTGEYKPNELIVKYKDDARRPRALMNQLYESIGVVKVKHFQGTRSLEQLILDENVDLAAALEEVAKSPIVEFVEPNSIVHALPIEESAARTAPSSEDATAPGGIPCIPGFEIPGCTPLPCIAPNFPPGCKDDGNTPRPRPPAPPNPNPAPPTNPTPPSDGRPPVNDKPAEVNPPIVDPDLNKAYGMSKIGAVKAWDAFRGSQNMIVAVIDTGVDYNHEDLSYNMWRNPSPDSKANDIVGYDFVHNDGLPFDDNEHGTHCAGVIGAVGGNGKGISGVNQRVSIMAVKFLSAEGSGDEASAIRAIDYAVEHGAKVLSNSWGGSGNASNVQGLKDAVLRADAKGVIFVAAAGNDGNNNDSTPEFPGGFNTPNLLGVAATNQDDQLANFSNYGKTTVHVAAPGVDVYSSIPGNKYTTLSGTSMACPHVAGAAALVWAANPGLSHHDVKQRLIDSVDKIPSLADKTLSGGRLNVANALKH